MSMKKPHRGYSIVIGKNLIFGIEPGTLVSIYLVTQRTGKDTMTYFAPIEFVHATLARKHARENPSGNRRISPTDKAS
jgi:hypothetical protein